MRRATCLYCCHFCSLALFQAGLIGQPPARKGFVCACPAPAAMSTMPAIPFALDAECWPAKGCKAWYSQTRPMPFSVRWGVRYFVTYAGVCKWQHASPSDFRRRINTNLMKESGLPEESWATVSPKLRDKYCFPRPRSCLGR